MFKPKGPSVKGGSFGFLLNNKYGQTIRNQYVGGQEGDRQYLGAIECLDDMITEDKRNQIDISDVIDFAVNDGFCRGVILNPYDLRKHFDRMNAIM